MTTITLAIEGGCDARIEALRSELGAFQTDRIIEAEAADFLWDARVRERYLGQHIDVGLGFDDEEIELSRVAVLSVLAGRWYSAACLVDGEGQVASLLWKRDFDDRAMAERAFERAD